MSIHPLAGKPAPESILENIPKLVSSYYTDEPQTGVSFGTSGHRGGSLKGSFNEPHIAAAAQAICEYRKSKGINGPLFLGFDTHALSEPAFRTTLEVLAANNVETVLNLNDEFTPTPVISFLILENNRAKAGRPADGIVITPSHNPPQDGGFKYNPPSGGPADVDITGWVQDRANEILKNDLKDVRRMPFKKARKADTIIEMDFVAPFVEALPQIVDMEAISKSGIKIGVDPMGGAGVNYWVPIAEKHKLNLEVVNPAVDPTFRFMTVDSDGAIRMDCSSPYAMANLIALADKYDIAWGNDPDYDRHGIVCPTGLMNPNHYLSAAVWYLLQNRPDWKPGLMVGKTLVSSSTISKVVTGLNSKVYEVPVGFKWFVDGLLDGTLAFGGEESAGASFLRMNGRPWSTDKDGFSLTLLAAEITAKTGRTPEEVYRETIIPEYGESYYRRVDAPITDEQKTVLKNLKPADIKVDQIAGQAVSSIMTEAPGNNAPIGGIKAELDDGSWFAIRPSGTEPKMKVYVESFGGEGLWQRIYDEAMPLVFG